MRLYPSASTASSMPSSSAATALPAAATALPAAATAATTPTAVPPPPTAASAAAVKAAVPVPASPAASNNKEDKTTKPPIVIPERSLPVTELRQVLDTFQTKNREHYEQNKTETKKDQHITSFQERIKMFEEGCSVNSTIPSPSSSISSASSSSIGSGTSGSKSKSKPAPYPVFRTFDSSVNKNAASSSSTTTTMVNDESPNERLLIVSIDDEQKKVENPTNTVNNNNNNNNNSPKIPMNTNVLKIPMNRIYEEDGDEDVSSNEDLSSSNEYDEEEEELQQQTRNIVGRSWDQHDGFHVPAIAPARTSIGKEEFWHPFVLDEERTVQSANDEYLTYYDTEDEQASNIDTVSDAIDTASDPGPYSATGLLRFMLNSGGSNNNNNKAPLLVCKAVQDTQPDEHDGAKKQSSSNVNQQQAAEGEEQQSQEGDDHEEEEGVSPSSISSTIQKFGGLRRSSGKTREMIQRRHLDLERQYAQNRAPIHTKKVSWQPASATGSYKKKVMVSIK